MKKLTLLIFISVFYIVSVQAQSIGDIFAPMDKVEKGNYMSRERSYVKKIGSYTGYQRGQNARYLSRTAALVKDLYSQAYSKTLTYEAKMKKSKNYNEIASKISSLKYNLKQAVRYSNTIKVYSSRIANNYKSGSNRDYFYEIQNAYNSLIKVKKNAREKLFSITSWKASKDAQKELKRKLEETKKRQIMLDKMKKK